jgi:hypothetical protein
MFCELKMENFLRIFLKENVEKCIKWVPVKLTVIWSIKTCFKTTNIKET